MQEHWEGWIRPLLLIAGLGTLGALGFTGVLPDRAFAWVILAGALAFGAVVVLVRLAAPDTGMLRRLVAAPLLFAALGYGIYVPWETLTDRRTVVAGELGGPEATLDLPATGDERARYDVHVAAAAGVGRSSAELSLEVLLPGVPFPLVHESKFTAGAGKKKAAERDVWHLRADLSRGGTLQARSEGDKHPRWPVDVHVVKSFPRPGDLVWPALPFVLLAIVLDGTRRRPTLLAHLSGSAVGLAALYGQLWTPGDAAKGMVFALLLGALAGSPPVVVAVAALRLATRRPRTPPPVEA